MAELAKLHQPQLTLLSQAAADLAKLHQPQFTLLSQAIARTYQPLLDAVLALERLDYDSLNTKSAFSSSDRLPQSLTDREIAAMLTVAAFLVVYISFGLLIKHSAQAARLAAIDGPTPFEAAMAVGALVFWLWMNRSRGSNDK